MQCIHHSWCHNSLQDARNMSSQLIKNISMKFQENISNVRNDNQDILLHHRKFSFKALPGLPQKVSEEKTRTKRTLTSSQSWGKRSLRSTRRKFTRPLRMGKRSVKMALGRLQGPKQKQKYQVQWKWNKNIGKTKFLKSFFPFLHLGMLH